MLGHVRCWFRVFLPEKQPFYHIQWIQLHAVDTRSANSIFNNIFSNTGWGIIMDTLMSPGENKNISHFEKFRTTELSQPASAIRNRIMHKHSQSTLKIHFGKNKCSSLKFVSLMRSGSDEQNPSHSPAIIAHLLFQRICQETGVPFKVLGVSKMEGKKEHHTVTHCVRLFNLE